MMMRKDLVQLLCYNTGYSLLRCCGGAKFVSYLCIVKRKVMKHY